MQDALVSYPCVASCTVTHLDLATHGTAFVIDPPTIESPDDPIVLCSTECPMAHGQVYDSPSGEVGLDMEVPKLHDC